MQAIARGDDPTASRRELAHSPPNLIDNGRGRPTAEGSGRVNPADHAKAVAVASLDLQDVHSGAWIGRVESIDAGFDQLIQDGADIAVRVLDDPHPCRSGRRHHPPDSSAGM